MSEDIKAADKFDRADREAEAIALRRIRSGAADYKEDGIEALATLGIRRQTSGNEPGSQDAETK
jgi:hypothetical protein